LKREFAPSANDMAILMAFGAQAQTGSSGTVLNSIDCAQAQLFSARRKMAATLFSEF